MIGKVMNGRGFGGLARYLESGKSGNHPERMEWIEARNLPTRDPRTVSLLMRATAAQSDRVQKPVYHLAISFDPGDPVDQTTMRQVAERLLADLGLQEHQALVVAHRDTGHPHLHVMLNRVHPETGRAWDPKNDYLQIERSLRIQERELGFREVPGHHHALAGQDRPDRADSLTTGQQRQRMNGQLPFVEHVRAVAAQEIRESRSWAELEQRLGAQGLQLVARGRGMTITDGQAQAKLSSLERGLSRAALEARFGDYTQHRELGGSVRASALEQQGGAVQERAMESGAGAGTRPDVPERSPNQQQGTRSEIPAARPATQRVEPGRPQPGSRQPDLVVERLVRDIQAWERVEELQAQRARMLRGLGEAEVSRSRLEQLDADARRLSDAFDRTLARVFQNPAEARAGYERMVESAGPEQAGRRLAERPEHFGELRSTEARRFFRTRDDSVAREAARGAAVEGRAALEARARAPGTEALARANEAVRVAQGQLNAVNRQLGKLPERDRLLERIGRQIGQLSPAQQAELGRSVPGPSLTTTMLAWRAVKSQAQIMER
jgi:hypothetical protein